MKVAIIGAGAMGQLFGAKIVDAGEDVVFLDVDQRTVDALNNEGIEVVNTAGERTVKVSATASQPANWNEPVDFALFFVKGFYTQDAIESARHLFNENTIALTLQNGLGNGEVLVRAFGPDRALDGVTDYSAYRPGKNTVSSSAYGAIRIGGASVDGDASAAAEKVRDLFERCGFNAEVHADVRVPIWEKLILNTVYNTVGAATDLTIGETLDREPSRRLAETVYSEAMAVVRSLEIPVREDVIREHLEQVGTESAGHKTSMTADVEAGRRTEVNTISGAVAAAGEKAGVATPVLATLADVVRARTEPAHGGHPGEAK